MSEPEIDTSESVSPHLRILDKLSKLEKEVLSFLTEEWTTTVLIQTQAPHLERQSITNNLMRLHKRNIIERTLPMNVKVNGKYYDGVRLWRRKS